MVHHSRRSFLKAGAGIAALGVVDRSAVLDSVSAQVLESAADKLMPFPILSGPFALSLIAMTFELP